MPDDLKALSYSELLGIAMIAGIPAIDAQNVDELRLRIERSAIHC